MYISDMCIQLRKYMIFNMSFCNQAFSYPQKQSGDTLLLPVMQVSSAWW